MATMVAALGVLGVWGLAPSARAQTVFDPTPGGPADNINNFTGFDFFPGNSLAFGAQPLTTGLTFPLLFQATTSAFNAGGTQVAVPAGTEFTIVLRVAEQVTSVADTSGNGVLDFASFRSVADPNNFLEIYASAPDANNLQGTNFNNGTLVLAATPLAGNQGSFLTDESRGLTTFDQAVQPTPTDNYDFNGSAPGTTTTIVGGGQTTLTARVNLATVNPLFFPNGFGPAGLISVVLNFTTENVTPFTAQDPSYRFRNAPGTGAPNVVNADAVAAGFTPAPPGGGITYTLGPVNGVDDSSAPNESFQIQTDANSTFTTNVVPEPGTISLGLTGIGMAFLGTMRTRRRRTDPSAA